MTKAFLQQKIIAVTIEHLVVWFLIGFDHHSLLIFCFVSFFWFFHFFYAALNARQRAVTLVGALFFVGNSAFTFSFFFFYE